MRRFGLILCALTAACSGAPQAAQEPLKALEAATSSAANASPAAAPVFAVQPGKFEGPMAMAFLADGRILVGLKDGSLKLRAANGAITPVAGVPAAEMMRDLWIAADQTIYIAYSEPQSAGGCLALARAVLSGNRLGKVQILWRGKAGRMDGSLGGAIAVSADQRTAYISGARQRWGAPPVPRGQRPKGYHRPIVAYGSIVRIDLPAPGAGGLLPLARVRAGTYSTGHRNPLGLAIAADGRLWEHEMGPRGGDELNLIVRGKDYGWPKVSNGDNYDGTIIPDHKPGDGFQPPVLFWNPSISPAGFILYSGRMFREWRGSGFMGLLSGRGVARMTISGGGAAKGDEWPMGTRIRDVAEAPDGAIWLIEDDSGDGGRLFRLGR
ncbi:PQQ-dependent sugar dehydrogenase [Sphingomonas sp. LB-2]|uniref:PQQ-dependent sugar dehydrogenase n=1 Tax=Sphingomonas caeni TaxID=2984949 RepID=UPI002230F5F4|nr:PQQ-dependent sugar dehydrogenase [Sphingomonas caeni]MCW3847732.1 PQQ-dependent sugar dehydrogenase [Sphingomonas caeni]